MLFVWKDFLDISAITPENMHIRYHAKASTNLNGHICLNLRKKNGISLIIVLIEHRL